MRSLLLGLSAAMAMATPAAAEKWTCALQRVSGDANYVPQRVTLDTAPKALGGYGRFLLNMHNDTIGDYGPKLIEPSYRKDNTRAILKITLRAGQYQLPKNTILPQTYTTGALSYTLVMELESGMLEVKVREGQYSKARGKTKVPCTRK